MDYQETLDYLYQRLPVFHLKGGEAYKPGLHNTIRLMQSLDNPHLKFKSIHVAGTNGKGSVSNMLSAILQTSGLKVGLYTSPHLIDFGERIRINGEMIDQHFVIDFVKKNQSVFETIQPSFFEATMAMAFDYFAKNNVDIAIIEVGLGGRLDSTNIITPELSIITNIGLDHVEFLGDTLEKIAFEKAGIIKNQIPVIIGETTPETKKVFLEKAKNEQAPIFLAEEIQISNFKMTSTGLISCQFDDDTFEISLTGKYQIRNTATVLKALEILNNIGYKIQKETIKIAFKQICQLTGLRGRWEILQKNPTIIADTAHNKAGIQVLCEQLEISNYRKLHIIIGMVRDKDIESVLKILPENADYYFTQAATERALDANKLALTAQKHHLNGFVCPKISEALELAIHSSDEHDLILITGSNFVVGEALQAYLNSF